MKTLSLKLFKKFLNTVNQSVLQPCLRFSFQFLTFKKKYSKNGKLAIPFLISNTIPKGSITKNRYKDFHIVCSSTYVMIWHYFDIYCVTRYTSKMLYITVLLIICKLDKTMLSLIMKYLGTFCTIISLLLFFPSLVRSLP